MKKEDPFARLKGILQVLSPEGFTHSDKKIVGEKLLPKYRINKHGVVDNETSLHRIDFHGKKWKGGSHICVKGAESTSGRWVTSLSYNFNNSGGCGPVMAGKFAVWYDSKEIAIICNLKEVIEMSKRENSPLARRIRNQAKQDIDKLIFKMQQ